MKDIKSDLGVSQSIAPQAVTATTNGTGIDLQGFNAALAVIDLGTFGGTTPTATIAIQESADNSTFTDVANADLLGGDQLAEIDTSNDVAVYKRGYKGTKRYLRVAVTAIGGTSPSLPMAAQIIRGHANDAPVA
jgi:hypothetical protein